MAAAVAASAALPIGTIAHAQEAGVSAPVVRTVARARGLIENGAGTEARELLDSLVRTLTPASYDLAEALYWRATLAEQASSAERDWKRLTIEAPLSPRAADALVRLGDLELLRGHPATARPYFDRVVRDFANTPQRVHATLATARSLQDERKTAEGCAALAGMPAALVPDGDPRLEYDELGRSCKRGATTVAPTPAASTPAASVPVAPAPAASNAAPTPATSTSTSTPALLFSVQLAAYDTRAEAEASAQRFTARGMDVRVDGDVKPFRVRTGRFTTRAQAATLLATLKKQGLDGFIAEVRR